MSTASRKPYIELVTGSVMFGMLGVFVDMLDAIPTLPMLYYKQVFGLLALLVFIILTGKLKELIPRKRKGYLLLLGLINTTTLLTYVTCIRYTSFSIAILMLYTAPIYITLLSPVILKESITKKGVVALIFSFTGLLFIVNPKTAIESFSLDNSYFIGIAAGILSGFSFGSEIMTIRYIRDDYSSVSQLFWYTLIGVILFMPFAGGVSQPVLSDNLALLVIFGIVNTALAALLYVMGISQIKAQTGSILALIEPVSGIFFDYTIIHTPLFMNTIVGCVFILVGAAIAVMEKSPKVFGKYFKVQV
ncbi:DMT family transporter [Methanolobus sp. ZRKC3]|uniref:DMT family transporter n=1 Tax=Methanolobus sp. ZRKC3 TaxID=3125786 RepID=UPI0032434C77